MILSQLRLRLFLLICCFLFVSGRRVRAAARVKEEKAGKIHSVSVGDCFTIHTHNAHGGFTVSILREKKKKVL